MVGPAAGMMDYELVPSTFTRWLSALSLTWLGICFIGFNFVVVWEFLNAALSLPRQTSGQLLLVATAAAASSGFINAQLIRVNKISIPAPMAAPRKRRIVHISDVHVGSRSSRLLRRVVAKANAQQPDYVVITGDLIDFRDIPQSALRALGDLESPSYFIIGNHERYVDLEEICQRLTNLGVRVLRNETLDLGDTQLIGIDDAESKHQVRTVLDSIAAQPERFRILLYHRPDGAADAAKWGAHLMLCGHTHHGQIVPFNFVVQRVFPQIRGLYDVDGLSLYVSPGTGTWGPILRLGSRSEIGMIELN